MLNSFPITEVLFLILREEINDVDKAHPPTNIIQQLDNFSTNPGIVRHYYGAVDEDPRVFVWMIDWESLELSESAAEFFSTTLGTFFEGSPLKIYQTWSTDPTAALEAPVTEIAYFTLKKNQYTTENKAMIEREMDVPSMEGIRTVGKSPGGAVGWVTHTANFAPPPNHTMALTGVFGYPTVEDHRRWRASPEHAQVMADFGKSEALAMIDMLPAPIPGGGIFVPEEKGMIHVSFRKGM